MATIRLILCSKKAFALTTLFNLGPDGWLESCCKSSLLVEYRVGSTFLLYQCGFGLKNKANYSVFNVKQARATSSFVQTITKKEIKQHQSC
jgi:hypothetical protein